MIRRFKAKLARDREKQSSKQLRPTDGARDFQGTLPPSNSSTSTIDVTQKDILATSHPSTPTSHDNIPSRSLTGTILALRPGQSPVGTPQPFQDKQTDGLRLLYEPAEGLKAVADIVFVHGLTGRSEKTWLDKESGIHWPPHLLAEDIPNVRILAFGYDADVTKLLGAVSQNSLRSHAEALLSDLAALRDETNTADRAIIFVVHSLGGLVTKKALCISESSFEGHLKQVSRCTKAIAFLGTPHRGSDLASFGAAVANILKAGGKRVNLDILELLKPNNQVLVEVEDSFGMWLRNKGSFNLTCFYEELELPGVGKVVTKDSAKIIGYVQIPIHANHKDMARFKSKTDSGYKRILGELRRWLNQIGSQTAEVRERTSKGKAALQSLAYLEMNMRGGDINDAAATTCEWLFQHEEYQTWFSQHQGLLWIKGKPGSGKSTLMKHAITACEQGKSTSSFVLLSFFFHGRGSLIQKTPLGLYRTILHQILDQFPDLLHEFAKLFENKEDKNGEHGEDWEWGENELKNLFRSYISEAARITQLRLYIDALDECGAPTARGLVVFFQDIVSKLPDEAALQLVFSCRHYPLLGLQGNLEIFVENENRGDIERYIQNELRRYIPNKEAVALLENTIIAKDSGIFQWVVLMVSIVIDLYLDGTRLSKIRDAIWSKPTQLHELYRDLLESIESEKRPKSLQIIQWVLFAKQPLSLDELRHAIAVESSDTSDSIAECLTLADCETNDELERRLRDLSRGLLEVVGMHRANRHQDDSPWPAYIDRIQFIHQSVLDFITDEGFQILDSSLNSSATFDGQSNFRLSRTCIRYFSMVVTASASWFPLLRYATDHWVEHAIDVEANNILQEDLLALFDWPSTTLLHKWIQHYVSTSNARYEYPPRRMAVLGMDLIHVAANNGLESVVRACLDRIDKKLVDLSPDRRDEMHRTPLSYAVESGHETLVKIFLERKDVDINSRYKGKAPPILFAVNQGHGGVVKLLLEQKEIKVNLKSKGRCALSAALYGDHEPITRLLLARDDIEVNVRLKGKSLLSIAVRRGNQTTVKMLLAHKDIDVNMQDIRGNASTPLCSAVVTRREAIIEMLLAHPNIDVDQEDKWGRTAATYATSEEILKILREHGATIPDETELNARSRSTAISRAMSNSPPDFQAENPS